MKNNSEFYSKIKQKTKFRLAENTGNICSEGTFDLPQILNSFRARDWEAGYRNLYVSPHLTKDGEPYGLWPILDIEAGSKTRHDNISANIEEARRVLEYMIQAGIADHIRIGLSGSGFRFVFPYIIPEPLKIAYLDFLRKKLKLKDMATASRTPIRIAGYRGHKLQGSPVKDVHVHYLSKPTDIFRAEFTADFYRRTVAGPEPKKQTLRALKELLPTMPPPERLVALLNEINDYRKLKSSIISRASKKKKLSDGDNKIRAALDSLDILVREQDNRPDLILPEKCPICGQAGKGYIYSDSGHLFCHRASCSASRENGGLKFKVWAANVLPDDLDWEIDSGTRPPENRETVVIGTARGQIRDAVITSFREKQDTIIRVTPGAGKTTTTLKTLHELFVSGEIKRALFALPTIDKAQELLQEAGEHCPGINRRLILGRNSENCRKDDACQREANNGFSPALFICPKCEHSGVCAYQAQFRNMNEPGLYITTHAQTLFMKDETDRHGEHTARYDLLINDENPSQFLKESNVSFSELFNLRIGTENITSELEKLQGLTHKMLSILEKKQKKNERKQSVIFHKPFRNLGKENTFWDMAGITGEDVNKICHSINFYQQHVGESFFDHQLRMKAAKINITALKWLETATGERTGLASIEVERIGRHSAISYTCRCVHRPILDAPVVLLDGTANVKEVNALYGREFRLVDCAVDISKNRFIHLRTAAGMRSTKRLVKDNKKRLQNVGRIAAEYFPDSAENVMIGTFKFCEDTIRDTFQDITPDKKFDSVHFGGNRGKNEFRNHDAGIIWGTLNINEEDGYKEACALFDNEQDIAEYIRHKSESETLQTIQRVGLTTGGKTVIVIANEYPFDLPPPEILRDLRPGKTDNLDIAYARAKAAYLETGFFNREMCFLLGIYCDREKHTFESYQRLVPDAVKKTMNKIAKNSHLAENAGYIGEKTASDMLGKNEFCLYINNSKTQILSAKNKVVFGDNHFYNKILTRLKADFSWSFSISGETPLTRTPGIGSLSAVRKFFEQTTGIKMNLDGWIETPPPTPRPVMFPAVGSSHSLHFEAASRVRMPFLPKPQIYDPPPPPAKGIPLSRLVSFQKSGPDIAGLPSWSRSVNHRALIRSEIMRTCYRTRNKNNFGRMGL